MYLSRLAAQRIARASKSVLLLGPRQTGKSTLVRSLQPSLEISLADEETYLEFLRNPGLLKGVVGSHRTVFIDEVQRIPSLLNTVQFIVDQPSAPKFYLTGSSARKLKRGKANLLPGRIFTYELGPLCCSELGQRFDARQAMAKGLLPGIYLEEDPATWMKLLRSYAVTYLKEEIQAESLTRSMEGFSRFFDVACSRSGDFIDFAKFAQLSAIERMSARRYFDVLVDTLVVQPVEAFAKSRRTRLVQHPRYYWFDIGVLNGALRNFEPSADRIGSLFEHLVLQLLLSEAKARDEDVRISVFRTEAGAEVDFILERGDEVTAIEVKATQRVSGTDIRGLKAFGAFFAKIHRPIVVYLGERSFRLGEVDVLPLRALLAAVFGAEISSLLTNPSSLLTNPGRIE